MYGQDESDGQGHDYGMVVVWPALCLGLTVVKATQLSMLHQHIHLPLLQVACTHAWERVMVFGKTSSDHTHAGQAGHNTAITAILIKMILTVITR